MTQPYNPYAIPFEYTPARRAIVEDVIEARYGQTIEELVAEAEAGYDPSRFTVRRINNNQPIARSPFMNDTFIHPEHGKLLGAFVTTDGSFRSGPRRHIIFEKATWTDRDASANQWAKLDAVAEEAGCRIIWPDSPGAAKIEKLETALEVLKTYDGLLTRSGCSPTNTTRAVILEAISLIERGRAK